MCFLGTALPPPPRPLHPPPPTSQYHDHDDDDDGDRAMQEDVAEERGTHMNLGQLARRRQQAETELAAVQAAADGVSDKVGG